MKGLIQRVQSARVEVDGNNIASIGPGVLLLLGVERHDTEKSADKLLHKLLNYRIFSDDDGKMNLSLLQQNAELLIVSQFTLVADTRKGLRPGFSQGASPELSKHLYEYMIKQSKQQVSHVGTGRFGADMKVTLCNDGPVTFLLES